MSKTIIRAKDLKKYFQVGTVEIRALDGVSFEIQEGEMLAIIGPSGSGKSTLMNMIGALDVPSSGTIEIDGVELYNQSEKELSELRGKKVGFVFQQFNLISYLSALDNVALPLVYQGIPQKERVRRAKLALTKVGLENRMDHFPRQLSGGQKQRVAIARAIVAEPSIVLADEPTGALDSKTSKEVMELFSLLNSEGRTIVVVTHDLSIAGSLPRQIRIRDGKIVETL